MAHWPFWCSFFIQFVFRINEKFTFFSKAAIQTLENLYWKPDFIICNDWQMSMAPKIIKNNFSDKFSSTKVVFIIHDLSDSYHFENSLW